MEQRPRTQEDSKSQKKTAAERRSVAQPKAFSAVVPFGGHERTERSNKTQLLTHSIMQIYKFQLKPKQIDKIEET